MKWKKSTSGRIVLKWDHKDKKRRDRQLSRIASNLAELQEKLHEDRFSNLCRFLHHMQETLLVNKRTKAIGWSTILEAQHAVAEKDKLSLSRSNRYILNIIGSDKGVSDYDDVWFVVILEGIATLIGTIFS